MPISIRMSGFHSTQVHQCFASSFQLVHFVAFGLQVAMGHVWCAGVLVNPLFVDTSIHTIYNKICVVYLCIHCVCAASNEPYANNFYHKHYNKIVYRRLRSQRMLFGNKKKRIFCFI